ncbi:hypothetical protein BpHYR1_001927 [Brachionus plicatilis]|uniref:Uncharacterized protein n=1 Tax=Brachionus plicatilis TaxID=10195 RepID=A0A3M7RRD3_BRAPC|nr:hypothetical protein BpHYR1_001927 [Brachionus plicatilis]
MTGLPIEFAVPMQYLPFFRGHVQNVIILITKILISSNPAAIVSQNEIKFLDIKFDSKLTFTPMFLLQTSPPPIIYFIYLFICTISHEKREFTFFVKKNKFSINSQFYNVLQQNNFTKHQIAFNNFKKKSFDLNTSALPQWFTKINGNLPSIEINTFEKLPKFANFSVKIDLTQKGHKKKI